MPDHPRNVFLQAEFARIGIAEVDPSPHVRINVAVHLRKQLMSRSQAPNADLGIRPPSTPLRSLM
jgi:hypothetical protein